MEKQHKISAADHDSYTTYSLIAFLIPLVGFIIGAIMLTKDDKVDRKLGEHAIVVSVLGIVAGTILYFGYFMMVASGSL